MLASKRFRFCVCSLFLDAALSKWEIFIDFTSPLLRKARGGGVFRMAERGRRFPDALSRRPPRTRLSPCGDDVRAGALSVALRRFPLRPFHLITNSNPSRIHLYRASDIDYSGCHFRLIRREGACLTIGIGASDECSLGTAL